MAFFVLQKHVNTNNYSSKAFLKGIAKKEDSMALLSVGFIRLNEIKNIYKISRWYILKRNKQKIVLQPNKANIFRKCQRPQQYYLEFYSVFENIASFFESEKFMPINLKL